MKSKWKITIRSLNTSFEDESRRHHEMVVEAFSAVKVDERHVLVDSLILEFDCWMTILEVGQI